MAQGRLDQAVHYARRMAADGTETDRDLILRYARDGDQQAFALLMDRHGGMVLAVCRRILGDAHEAEDAFQATWLVLARRAGAVNWSEGVGGWLHAVARKVAIRLRSRPRAPQSGGLEAVPAPEAATADADMLAELDRLPERHRAPLVLIHLEGMTNAQAARVLGIPEGSMSKRLAQARDALRRRLEARGLASPAALPLLAAAVPAALRQTTLAAAGLLSAGAPLTAATTAAVAALARGVITEMTRSNVKAALLLALSLAALCVSGGLAGLSLLAADKPPTKTAAAAVEPPAKARAFKSALPFLVYQIADGEPIKVIGQTGPGIAKAVQIPAAARWAVQPVAGVAAGGGGGIAGGFAGAFGNLGNGGGQLGFGGGALGAGGGFGGALGQFGNLGNLGGQFGFGGGAMPPGGKGPAGAFAKLSGEGLRKLLTEVKKQSIPGLVLGGQEVSVEDFGQIAGLTQLRTLVLLPGGFTDEHLAKLADARALRTLALLGVPLKEAGLKHLAATPGLTELHLHGDGLDGKALASLGDLKRLEALRRERGQAGDEKLDWLKSLPRLKKIELSGGYTDDDLKAVKGMTTLEVVRLYQTAVSDAFLDDLKGNKGLRTLTLDGHWGLHGIQPMVSSEAGKTRWTIPDLARGGGGAAAPKFTGKALEKLAAFEGLTELHVSNTGLKDADLAALAKLRPLRRLTVFAPSVTDKGVGALKALTRLEYLDLRGTDMTTASAAALKALPALKSLKVNVVAQDAAAKKRLAAWKAQLPKARVEAIQAGVGGGFGIGGIDPNCPLIATPGGGGGGFIGKP